MWLVALLVALMLPRAHVQFVAVTESETRGELATRDALQTMAQRATDRFLAQHVIQPGSLTKPLLRNFYPPPLSPLYPPNSPKMPQMPQRPSTPHHPSHPPPPNHPPKPPLPNVELIISKQQKLVDSVVTRRKLHVSVVLYWDPVWNSKRHSHTYEIEGMTAWDTFLHTQAKGDTYLTYEKREGAHYKPSDVAIYWGGYNKNDVRGLTSFGAENNSRRNSIAAPEGLGGTTFFLSTYKGTRRIAAYACTPREGLAGAG
jgi:hypothetical protein